MTYFSVYPIGSFQTYKTRNIFLISRLICRELQHLQPPSCIINLMASSSLYESIDDLLQLPISQQVSPTKENRKWVQNFSDESLRVLDACGEIREVFSQTKGYPQKLQSSLRRRRNRD
ncbi:hypothetical protein CDL12_11879 [Handroanthus impetiginosus]|uniref:Uncharacterized protein n=1 Tax=Handroanthus impetiginosus TaxID=429701 RepID=A0A2G9HDA0_9LAMI|nr:hypothetical protein CDL12_11879 [Handroanthus impetiginosus]